MFTFCPGCSTVFTVKAEQLHAAGGLVRCGNCNHLYSAVNYLFEEIDVARDAAAEYQVSREQTEAADSGTSEEERLARQMEVGASSPGPAVAMAREQDRSAVSATSRSLPGGWQQRTIAWHDVISGSGIGLLILLLGIQWLYFNRTELANDTGWRPTMERFCDFLHCDLPFRVDLERLELLERDVRKHPRADDALLINATLVNHAGHIQPFPVVTLIFSDLSGKPVAGRHFRPAEYLGDTTAITTGMVPGSRGYAVLEIEDPGKDAISFQIDFL